ncbi:MAG TPA: hypothetical protein VN083_02040, partial [Vicinamibacteria bacterium]|nr:hypothetical protein [Vicinamibacteria bacterium]
EAAPRENIVAAPVATIGFLDEAAERYDFYVARFRSRWVHYHLWALKRGLANEQEILEALERTHEEPSGSYFELAQH